LKNIQGKPNRSNCRLRKYLGIHFLLKKGQVKKHTKNKIQLKIETWNNNNFFCRYNRILSTTNSLPRHISLVMSSPPSLPDGSRPDPPPESLQDLSLQSLQWLESRGIHSGHHRRSSLSEQMHSNGYQRSVK